MTTFLLVGLSLLFPSTARAQRLESGAFVTYAFLEEVGSHDHGVGTSTLGLGGRAVWHLVPFVDLDGELAVHPNAGVSGFKLEGFVGAKAGVRQVSLSNGDRLAVRASTARRRLHHAQPAVEPRTFERLLNPRT